MDETLSSGDFPPPWLIRICRWLWISLCGWWAFGTSLFCNLVAALFFAPISPLSQLTQFWAFQYKITIVIVLLVLLCLILFIGYISKFETIPSIITRQRHYLQQMRLDHEQLKASGIPEIFFPPSIKLDEVFISPSFINERILAGIDYPLREEELPIWRRIFAQRRKRVPREFVRSSAPKTMDLAGFWQRFTKEHPVAVVQGYPGMGKSTLMKRLVLHMARRGLNMHDPRLAQLSPVLVPLLIELKRYADALKQAQKSKEELPISNYLPQMMQKRTWQGKNPWPFISASLERGSCLVLFDGLDEAGDVEMRAQVAREINAFILEQRNTAPESKTFNRFIITSRVAGYSPEAFPDALPYRLAELTERRMHSLLNLWYNAVLKEEPAARDAETRMQQLHETVAEHGPIFRLAENPLLLMLMAAMQKYGINLPQERAELYDTITLTLLKYREKDKDLPPIDEDEAVRRLGPLAYTMQATNYIADEQTVMDSLRKTIKAERRRNARGSNETGDPATEQAAIEKQARAFLTLIRERSNLFVQRTDEDFSFFHKSFQEYFAARYMLNKIPHRRNVEIAHLVELARQSGDTWREPFLFAVGYQSLGRGRDQTVARDLLKQLLAAYEKESDPAQRAHDLLLAAEALIEAKAQVFDDTLQKPIAQGLLPLYMEALDQQEPAYIDILDQIEILDQQQSGDNRSIERIIQSWLLSLTPEDRQSPLLLELCAGLQENNEVRFQRAILALLVIILNRADYPQVVYEALIPSLLGLTNLPPLAHYQPIPYTHEVDYTVVDLALDALASMGSHGPNSIFLGEIRQHFEKKPEQLRLLARYALEKQDLLISFRTSRPDQSYEFYLRWEKLSERRMLHFFRPSNEATTESVATYQELLASASGVAYPESLYLLAMLNASHAQQDLPWQEIWRTYLRQLRNAEPPIPYACYREIIWLWARLFPEQHNQKFLAELILADYTRGKIPYNFYARHSLYVLSEELQYALANLQYVGISYHRLYHTVSLLPHFAYSHAIFPMSSLHHALFITPMVDHTIQLLQVARETEVVELFTILLGCVLQKHMSNENGQVILEEIQRIAETTNQGLAKTNDEQQELRAVLLNILFNLSARSGEEITFIRQLAENASDMEAQKALADALRFDSPRKDALSILQKATTSPNELIADAARQALENTRQRRYQ